MAKSTKVYSVQTIQAVAGLITGADAAATKKQIFVAGADGSVIKSLGLVSTDPNARVVQLFRDLDGAGTSFYPIGTVPVPASAGNNSTTAAVDVLRSSVIPQLEYDAYGNKILYLQPGEKLYVAATTALAPAATIAAVGTAGGF